MGSREVAHACRRANVSHWPRGQCQRARRRLLNHLARAEMGRGALGGQGCREDDGTAFVSFEMGSENQGTLTWSGAWVWRFPQFRPAPSAAPQTRGRCGPRGRGRTTRLPRTQLSLPQTAQHEGQALSREVSVTTRVGGCDLGPLPASTPEAAARARGPVLLPWDVEMQTLIFFKQRIKIQALPTSAAP